MISDWQHRMRLWHAALRRILRYPLRSGLLVLCASTGIAGVIAATNYAASGRTKVLAQVERLGTRLVTVNAERSVNVADRGRTGNIVTTLREDDYLALQREFEELAAHSAIVSRSLRIKGGGQSRNATVFGVEPAYLDMKSWQVAAGEPFDAASLRQSARVVLLGSRVARDLFGNGSAVGETVFINRIPFEVIGLLASRGIGLDGVDEDDQVFVPLSTAMRRVMDVDHYNAIALQVADDADVRALTEAVTAVLLDRHPQVPGREPDFTVRNSMTLIDAEMASARRLDFLTLWISAATLTLAGLGILAMAWIATRDRIREIGTLRALGARQVDIFGQFASEAGLLSVVGTVFGVTLGIATSVALARLADLPLRIETGNAALAAIVALIVNVAFACWPALRAARADPIDALRHG